MPRNGQGFGHLKEIPYRLYIGSCRGDGWQGTPNIAAVQLLGFVVLSCNGRADKLSNPVLALSHLVGHKYLKIANYAWHHH